MTTAPNTPLTHEMRDEWVRSMIELSAGGAGPVRFMTMRDYERDRNRILPTDARWDAAPIERVERVSPVIEIPLPNPPRFIWTNGKFVRMEAPAENTPVNSSYT